MRINKVKVTKEGKIAIEYQVQRGEGWDDYSLKCSEKARNTFYQAMDSLREHVNELCEFPEEFVDRIIVKGVSFSYGGEREIMGAVITAQLMLNNSVAPLNINTPHKTEEMYAEDVEEIPEMLLTPKACEALRDVIEEATVYINGDRAQGKLL